LAAGARTADVHVAAAHGLTLEAVTYPRDADLAAQAEAARRKRELGGTPP
jgi:tRNA pseudouridine38-40 synthase